MSKHNFLFFDFETYYDREYSLKQMAPPNYILDPRFETIGCSFGINDEPKIFVDGPEVPGFLAGIDHTTTTTVAFNALFDNCILAWRYGFIPVRMVCTMRMAVAVFGHELRGHSLAKVGAHLGVGTKGSTISDVCGMSRSQIMSNIGLWRAYQAYSNNDNEMSAAIFDRCTPLLPGSELRIMDRVLRCAVDPQFVCDTTMLREHLEDLKLAKINLLAEAMEEDPPDLSAIVPGAAHDNLLARQEAFARTLRSSGQFEEILKAHGVDIEYKTSGSTGQPIPCFAKTDEFMSDLLEHDDPVVVALANARLGLRSTIEETRGARLLSIAELPSCVGYRGGNLPMPLKYAGAHTHRLAGDWSLNVQNLPSGRGKQKSKLRKALKAPYGYKVVVADKSQIECRINAWLCGQQDLLEIFATGGDPYSVLASSIFGFPVDKKVHLTERFIGKAGVLGLGFGCGDTKFYNMVVRSARVLGMDMKALLKVWTQSLATLSVGIYRSLNANIVATWRRLDVILKTAWIGLSLPTKFGPCVIGKGYVEGPGGLRMSYANPRVDENGDLRYDYGVRSFKMYGSKFLENIVQFLARINTMHDALRISDRGYRFVLQSHDELAWIVPDDKVQECMAVALEEMCRPPSWAKSLPLNAECSYGQSYGDAK